MTVTLTQFAGGTIGTTTTAVYSPSGVSGQVDACIITNNSSGTTATISLWVTAGGSPADQNIILKDFSITAGTTKKSYEVQGQVIPDGASLYAKASVDGILTLVVSGRAQTT